MKGMNMKAQVISISGVLFCGVVSVAGIGCDMPPTRSHRAQVPRTVARARRAAAQVPPIAVQAHRAPARALRTAVQAPVPSRQARALQLHGT